jgi:hypothetical protein
LFTRHVSGCIIVANTSNPDSIKKAQIWKEHFDEKTKVKDEPTIPCTLFINHDLPIKLPTKKQGSAKQMKACKSNELIIDSERNVRTEDHPVESDLATPVKTKEFISTPELLPITKKQALMDQFYDKCSNNKRRINATKGMLPSPEHYSMVNENKLSDYEKLANIE